ncbi:hypothetical protein [Streptomyces sp. NPDC085540]
MHRTAAACSSTTNLDEGAHVDGATLVTALEGAGDHTARLAD